MAFGIERLQDAVNTLTQNVANLGESIRASTSDARTRTLDAVSHTRSQLASSIDSTRSDLGRRIDATHTNVDHLTRDLGAARREIAELQALIQTWRAEAAQTHAKALQGPEPASADAEQASSPPVAPPTTSADSDQTDENPLDRHLRLISHAAGISQAAFTCHRDLWAHFVKNAGNEPHFHIPGEVSECLGNIRVTLSGPTLVAALTAMWRTREQSSRDSSVTGDWALANELYEAVAAAIDTVRDIPRHRDRQKVAIVIDRQPGDGEPEQ